MTVFRSNTLFRHCCLLDARTISVERLRVRLVDAGRSAAIFGSRIVEGDWLKLATTDYDFKANMSTSEAPSRGRLGFTSHIVFLLDGKFEVDGVCVHRIYTLELSSCTNKITPWTSHRVRGAF